MADVMPKNPSPIGDTEIKIPIYADFVGAVDSLSDGKLGFGDITSIADLGLGMLSTALDPLGAILGAAVDYLMNLIVDNIKPLGDAVDMLLGDPDGIAKVATAWSDAGREIANNANSHVASVSDTPSWSGPAAEAYKGVVKATHGVYQAASGAAASVSGWVGVAGAIVGTFREFMWGMLKDFITEVLKAAILALASAIPSFGASVAAFGTWFGARMGMMAGKFSKTLSKLMTKMGNMARKLGLSGRKFDVAAEKLRQAASRLGRGASGRFGRSGVDATPRLPGDSTKPFKDAFPGYDDFNKNYKRGKRVSNAVDEGAHNTQDGNSTPINDLPAGY
ncbi:hypothetical protein ACQBAR_03780 [Propionibacteriaceae bacterium Y1685]|uniref:hypothetical protein n=1 Tax=Microlunatus sp. Y1700 TaxID=3418487 RepID=UPI003B78B562